MVEVKQVVSDCLVLKFEEIEDDTNNIDTTIFIFYDTNQKHYVVRGKRRDTKKYQSCTYSFNCQYASGLVEFLQYIICHSNSVNETLFNFDNLPMNSDDITYEYLYNYDHPKYELSGYNNAKILNKKLLKKLEMLKNIYNYYM